MYACVTLWRRRKTIAPPNASKFYATGRRRRAPPDAFAAYVHDVLSPSSSLGTAVEAGDRPQAVSPGDSDDDMPLAQLVQAHAPGDVPGSQATGGSGEVLDDRCVCVFCCVFMSINHYLHSVDDCS